MMLHVDSNIVSSVISGIEAEHEKTAKMTIGKGKIHKFIGMTIDYYLPGKLICSMVDFIVKMINDTP